LKEDEDPALIYVLDPPPDTPLKPEENISVSFDTLK
jgi:hypothetical protein